MKVLLKSFHLIGHKLRFDLWTQNYNYIPLLTSNIIELISLSELPNHGNIVCKYYYSCK